MAKFLCLPVLLLILLFPKYSVAAQSQIVINELLPTPDSGKDWVELYNPSSTDINISGWILDDEGTSTNMLQIPSGEIINKNSFKVFYVSNRLNKSGDTVFLRNEEGEIDRFEYKSTESNISYGRYPDGGNDWGICEPTPEEKNAGCTIETEEETKEEGSSNANDEPENNIFTPTPSPVTKKSSPSPKPKKTLGIKNKSIPKLLPPSSPSATPELEETNKSSTKIASFLTGVGAILVGASLFFYFWYYKVKNKPKSSGESETQNDIQDDTK